MRTIVILADSLNHGDSFYWKSWKSVATRYKDLSFDSFIRSVKASIVSGQNENVRILSQIVHIPMISPSQ